jgi:putative transposase
MNVRIPSAEVYDFASGILFRHLRWRDRGPKCTVGMMCAVLFFAAARVSSLFDACRRLRAAPSDEAVRKALHAWVESMTGLRRRLNRALQHRLPKSLLCRPCLIGMDVTQLPYYGQPERDRHELRRGRPHHGTSWFHAYATAYVIRRGERFTVAMDSVEGHESLADVLRRLVRQVRQAGIPIRFLLLDRGFYNVEVVRYLKRARVPFLMPAVHRGRTPWRIPVAQVRGTRRFLTWRRSGWSNHRMQRGQRCTTVNIAVAYQSDARHRRRVFVYAYWGFQPPAPAWVHETYRLRFGIETSYRQMNQARIRTCTRSPVIRLLLVGIALILRNVWVWWHRMYLSRHRGQGWQLHLEALRFRTLLLLIQQYSENFLGYTQSNKTSTALTS